MELNIKKAFLSPFSDEKWYIKLIFPSIMAIFSLLANAFSHTHMKEVLLLSLIVFIPALVLSGFFLQFAHNEIHDETPLLPNLQSKAKEYFNYGLRIFGISLLYAITLGIVACIVLIVLNIILGIILGLIIIMLHLDRTALSLGSLIIFLITYIPILIFMFAYLIMLSGAFADNFNSSEARDYKRLYRLLTKVKVEMIIYFLLEFCLIISVAIMIIILAIPKFTLVFAPIITAIIQLISMNLKAQIYKVAKSRLEEQPQNA